VAPRDPSTLRFVMEEFQPSSRGGPMLIVAGIILTLRARP
jgi:hypothetical protein